MPPARAAAQVSEASASPRAAVASQAPTSLPARLTPELALRLQRSAGNAVVGAVLARQTAVADSWHLDRNRFNALPVGKLSPVDGASPTFTYQENGHNSYRDEAGVLWVLEPDWKTAYHQPPGHKESGHPFPNKKLLHVDASGGSSEAIMAPDGSYITTGPLRGTYNYSHPSGAWGSAGHVLMDVAPHELPGGDQYRDFPALDPRVVDIDTYRLRWEAQVQPIGENSSTNVTDPTDRTITTQTGVLWIQHPSGETVLAVARATNGRLSFRTFVDTEMREQALARGRARQPRGIQTLPGAPPYIFDVPAAIPPKTARL